MGKNRHGFTLDFPICFWLFQCHAHLYNIRSPDHVSVQASFLVRILSDGNYDTRNLLSKTQEGI